MYPVTSQTTPNDITNYYLPTGTEFLILTFRGTNAITCAGVRIITGHSLVRLYGVPSESRTVYGTVCSDGQTVQPYWTAAPPAPPSPPPSPYPPPLPYSPPPPAPPGVPCCSALANNALWCRIKTHLKVDTNAPNDYCFHKC